MKRGIAQLDGYHGIPQGDADLVAQWISLTPGYAGMCHRPSKGRPVIYLESHLDASGYRDLLRGRYDDRLKAIRDCLAFSPKAIKRWDHEMDGAPMSTFREWGQMEPELYKAGSRHVAGILGPLFWCPTAVIDRWDAYYPGDEFVDFVGWDQYARQTRPIKEAWAPRIRALDRLAPGKRKLVGEFGSDARLTERAEWLATIDDVQDVWGAIYFDVKTGGDDWTMDQGMRDFWG